jgi:16S rRNA (adenine1518-N6/adenine1519-N6)-dimethyltransferase
LNGRGQLKAYCPECDTALSGDTASRQYAFPVIGGPSVGKTCFINMAIDQMMSDVAPARSWKMSFISDTEEKDHALAMKSLNQGVRLMKTELNSLTAYQLMLKLPNEKIGRRIYVYDISGEMFSSSSDVQNNLAYSYANGFIFIIDPLTLNQFAMDVEDKVDLNAYGASSKDFDDILNIMLINLEKMFGLKDKDTLKRNLAVVINKVDIPTLEEKIGETAAQQYLAENAREVMAVEIDKNLIPILSDTLSAYDNVSILNADILKVDIAKIVEEKNGGKPVKVVANLPYYITTPIIMGLFESHVPIDSITVMVQKEVADRMQEGPGSKEYGALSLAVQYYAKPEIVVNVPPSCFMPQPKVGSAVIRLTRHSEPPVTVKSEKLLFQVIRASFNQRRKTLANGLANYGAFGLPKEELQACIEELGVPVNIRGEALSLEQFAQLSNIIYDHRSAV